MDTDKDTVQISAINDGLIAKPGKETIPLKAAADNLFFIQPPACIRHNEMAFE